MDAAGNVYIADSDNFRVRVVNAQTGIITTFAGSGNPSGSGSNGDGGPATQADLIPQGLALDSAGDLYIANSNIGRVRMVNAQTGIISTVAGGGTNGLGDGGLATQATLSLPDGLAFDSSDNLYIADGGDRLIRMVSAQTGIITTIAGNGDEGTSGDGGPATQAELSLALGIVVDKQGNVYTSGWPGEVRKISKADGTISLYAGNGYCSGGGDGGAATMAGICEPNGLALDAAGNLYIAELGNARVRKVTAISGTAATPTFTPAAGTYTGSQSVTISDTTANATIYYTTDGTTPTTASTQYSSAITVAQSETVQAIAVATGYLTSAVGSASYTITAPPPPPATYSLAATNVTLTRGAQGTSTVTVSSTTNYVGTVTLHCSITASPANAVDTPTCAVSSTVTLSANATTGATTVTVTSTAASASLSHHEMLWKSAGGGMALATLLFLFAPRRRHWLRMLGALAFLAMLTGAITACGGGGSSGGSDQNQQTNPGTTSGAYTITVSGTGNDTGHTTASTTFTLTVN